LLWFLVLTFLLPFALLICTDAPEICFVKEIISGRRGKGTLIKTGGMSGDVILPVEATPNVFLDVPVVFIGKIVRRIISARIEKGGFISEELVTETLIRIHHRSLQEKIR
jgi:hypothetical protein